MYKAKQQSGELMENKVIRVGGYISSTREQAKEGYSIPAQTEGKELLQRAQLDFA